MQAFLLRKEEELSEPWACLREQEQSDIGLHCHDFFELTYILDGEIEHTMDGASAVLKKGNYFFVGIGTAHRYRRIGKTPCKLWNFLFLPEFIDRTLAGCEDFAELLRGCELRLGSFSAPDSPADRVFFDANGRVLALLTEIRREYAQRQCGYLEAVRCALVRILIETIRQSPAQEPPDDLCRAICAYLDRHYREPLRLDALSRALHYSPAYLSARFRAGCGRTMQSYCQRLRILESCRLLSGTELKISEVAHTVGYENLKFFNRLFREALHMTPREYRVRSRAQEVNFAASRF